MSALFISHSSRDRAAAQNLKARLEEQGHRSVFLDLDPEKGIQAGSSWERTLYTKLRACRAVVAVCTDNYLASQWCFAEIALARMEGKEIFTLQANPWSATTAMPSILAESQRIDLRVDPDEGYARLWHGFKNTGILPAEHREWTPNDPPYPGLQAFDEKDAPVFFGRDKEIQDGIELLNRVQRQGDPRLILVLGASGSGKSSLARAGLVPNLRLDEKQYLVVGPLRPGRQPARELASAFSEAFAKHGQPVSWEEILRRLEPPGSGGVTESPKDARIDATIAGHEQARERLLQALAAFERESLPGEAHVNDSVQRLRAVLAQPRTDLSTDATAPLDDNPLVDFAARLKLCRGPSDAAVLLVIDQFEELLGHDAKGAEHPANRCLALLRDALRAEGSPLFVLATMRSDHLETFQTSIALGAMPFKSLSLGPMSREGMRQVILEPARLGQIEIEQGLTDLLLDDTGSADALPLLAFTLRVMWDRCRQRRLLGLRDYQEIGGLQGAIARVADETLESALRLGQERDLQDAFLSLSRPIDEGGGWTRQPANWEQFSDVVRHMLQPFVDQRLLVRREDGTVEVAHEALFRSWHRLKAWLDQDREFLLWRKRLTLARQEWERIERDTSALLTGPALAEARSWGERKAGRLGSTEAKFVDVSIKAAKRRRMRGVAALSSLFVALLVVAVGGLALWRRAEEQRSEAQRQTLVAEQRRAENQQSLAKGLLGAVSLEDTKPISRHVDALWSIATLAEPDAIVRQLFLRNALSSAEGSRQILRNGDAILHALIGLNARNLDALREVAVASLMNDSGGLDSLLASMKVAGDLDAYDERSASVAAQRIVAAINSENAAFNLSSVDVLARLGNALGALGPRLPEQQATEAAHALLISMQAARDQDFGYRIADIGSALGSLAERLPADTAWEATKVLMPLFHSEGTVDAGVAIGFVLGSLSERLSDEQVRSVAGDLAKEEYFTNANLHVWQGEAGKAPSLVAAAKVLAAALRREPAGAERTRLEALLVACLEQQVSTKTADNLERALTEMLANPKYANLRSDAAAALQALQDGGNSLGKPSDDSEPDEGPKLPSEIAALKTPEERAAAMLKLIEETKDPYTRANLAIALGNAAADLPEESRLPAAAAQVLVDAMRWDFNVRSAAAVGIALVNIGDRVPTALAVDAARLLSEKADQEIQSNVVSWESEPATAFGRLATVVPESMVPELINALLRLARNSDDEIDLKAPLAAVGSRLDPQGLVETLKQPLCIGRARAEILAMLEQRTGRQFHGDIRELVSQAEELGLDVSSPPRPLAEVGR